VIAGKLGPLVLRFEFFLRRVFLEGKGVLLLILQDRVELSHDVFDGLVLSSGVGDFGGEEVLFVDDDKFLVFDFGLLSLEEVDFLGDVSHFLSEL
jgi:hypothetical protein